MSDRRAVPGPIIDLIRDGVEPGSARNGRATYGAAVRTAMSAVQRGWTYPDWHALVLDANSTLGIQLARTHPQLDRTLRQAWKQADRRVRESPAMTHFEAACLVDDLEAVLPFDSSIDPATRLVVQHAVDLARLRGTRRVALPWRDVVKDTGLTESVAKRVLRHRAHGYLQLAERGRQGLHGRASLYWLRHPTSPVPGRCP